ncbi:biotin/lipoyl-containing protein, partial [Paenibacillus puerhi]|uniref:biotin/lipoyl-containing protein n=1 Tax=Paenibacillus puerhi TaxID=2692622 RepID=UPI00135B0F03
MNPKKKNKMTSSSKVLSAVVISTALVAGCSAQPAEQPAVTAESQVKTVKVAPVEKKKIGEPLEQVADISASVQMDIVAKVNGDVLQVLKKRGEFVEQGDILFRIDPTDLQIQKEKAQISVAGT